MNIIHIISSKYTQFSLLGLAMVVSFFSFGGVASAGSVYVKGCTVTYNIPQKISNNAVAKGSVKCTNTGKKVKITESLYQRQKFTGLLSLVRESTVTSYNGSAVAQASAGCRYGSYSNWYATTTVWVDNAWATWQPSTEVSIPCDI